MQKVGIWLDKEKAHIVTLKDGEEHFETVLSELEFFHPKGGSRSKTRWGPQEVVQDSRYLEREKHQLKKYFQVIGKSIKDADMLVLFGPAQAGEKLRKELSETHPNLAAKIIKVAKADSMTDNQVKALVRDFYKAL
jgi:stalled ribosome rescue protein Dom34